MLRFSLGWAHLWDLRVSWAILGRRHGAVASSPYLEPEPGTSLGHAGAPDGHI